MDTYETTNPVQEDSPIRVATSLNKILSGSFLWMMLGLIISTITSFIVLLSPALLNAIVNSTWGFLIAILLELGIVIYLSRRLATMSVLDARCMFIAYSILSGATLSVIFFAFQLSSIISIFFGTAVMFAALAIYGASTKRDLTGIGRIAGFALIGLIFAMIANFFIGGDTLQLIISWAGVIIFTILTARDTQRIKSFASVAVTDDDVKKAKIRGALMLYLDFINLFLDLLRIFGGKR